MLTEFKNVGAGIPWSHKEIFTTRDYDNDLKVGYFCIMNGTTLKNITAPLGASDFLMGVVLNSCCGSVVELGLLKKEPMGIASYVAHGQVTCKIANAIVPKRGQQLFVVVKVGSGADFGTLTNVQGTDGTDTVTGGLYITAEQPVDDGAWLVNIL